MDTRIDHKGKYFTERLTKQHIAVVARTAGEFVHGMACLAPENRLKDELNQAEGFLAILDAEVRDGMDKLVLYTAPVVLLNRQQLVWVLPLGREGLKENASGAAVGEDE